MIPPASRLPTGGAAGGNESSSTSSTRPATAAQASVPVRRNWHSISSGAFEGPSASSSSRHAIPAQVDNRVANRHSVADDSVMGTLASAHRDLSQQYARLSDTHGELSEKISKAIARRG